MSRDPRTCRPTAARSPRTPQTQTPPFPRPVSTSTERGRSAEAAILQRYLAAGYRELGRNVRVGMLEIDLIVVRHGLVVFCEVRSRADSRAGHPAATVDPRKRQRIRTAAARWIASTASMELAPELELNTRGYRFDVATIVGHGVNAEVCIYPNAF